MPSAICFAALARRKKLKPTKPATTATRSRMTMSRTIVIFERAPVADGDQRAGEIDHRRQRAEPDAVQNDADNFLAQAFRTCRSLIRVSAIRCVR